MSLDSARFAARWSRPVWVVTIGIVATNLIVEVLLVWAAWEVARMNAILILLVVPALLPLDILVTVAVFAPWSYTVRPDAIAINRLGPPVILPYDRVAEIRRIAPRDIGFAWRASGVGGFLGWFGWYWSRRLGGFRAYATNRQDLILVVDNDGTKIVLSPYPPEAFLEAIQRAKHRSV